MSAELEGLLAGLLCSADPVQALADARASTLGPEAQAALAHVDADGLAVAALLVAKLRFERLIHGSSTALGWFERDPGGFSAAFKRYHTQIAPLDPSPQAEAKRFQAWCENDGDAPPPGQES